MFRLPIVGRCSLASLPISSHWAWVMPFGFPEVRSKFLLPEGGNVANVADVADVANVCRSCVLLSGGEGGVETERAAGAEDSDGASETGSSAAASPVSDRMKSMAASNSNHFSP